MTEQRCDAPSCHLSRMQTKVATHMSFAARGEDRSTPPWFPLFGLSSPHTMQPPLSERSPTTVGPWGRPPPQRRPAAATEGRAPSGLADSGARVGHWHCLGSAARVLSWIVFLDYQFCRFLVPLFLKTRVLHFFQILYLEFWMCWKCVGLRTCVLLCWGVLDTKKSELCNWENNSNFVSVKSCTPMRLFFSSKRMLESQSLHICDAHNQLY